MQDSPVSLSDVIWRGRVCRAAGPTTYANNNQSIVWLDAIYPVLPMISPETTLYSLGIWHALQLILLGARAMSGRWDGHCRPAGIKAPGYEKML